jgi:galactokinase
LRDVSHEMLIENKNILDEDTYIKCLFIIEEIDRTKRAAEHLKKNDLKEFGKLMFETHWGLSQAYEISCAESDFLVTLAEEEKEVVLGARQMGGGFGGCTINLIRKDSIKSFQEKVRSQYVATFKKEPEFYSVNLSQGVSLLPKP